MYLAKSRAQDYVLIFILCLCFIPFINCHILRHKRETDDSFIPLSPDASPTYNSDSNPPSTCEEQKPSSAMQKLKEEFSSSESNDNCESCGGKKTKFTSQQMRELRYDLLKEQILRKLQLTSPPCPKTPKPALQPLLLAAEMMNNETTTEEDAEDKRKIDSAVVYPNGNVSNCKNSEDATCRLYQFMLPKDFGMSPLASIEMWVYKADTAVTLQLTQVVYDIWNEEVLEKKVLALENNNGNPHWVKFMLPFTINWSSENNRKFLNAEVSCHSGCNFSSVDPVISDDSDKRPFLVIRSYESKAIPRNRRSVDCTLGSTACCRESFFLSFAEIGWNEWIIHPEGYNANYCRGKCLNDVSTSRFHHSTFLLRFIQSNSAMAEEMGLKMCCTPSAMGALSIIYRDQEGFIFHRSMPNMIVEACDCA